MHSQTIQSQIYLFPDIIVSNDYLISLYLKHICYYAFKREVFQIWYEQREKSVLNEVNV